MSSPDIFNDRVAKQQYSTNFSDVLGNWQTICDKIPEEWQFTDKEMTVSADFSLGEMLILLELCQKEEFWGRL